MSHTKRAHTGPHIYSPGWANVATVLDSTLLPSEVHRGDRDGVLEVPEGLWFLVLRKNILILYAGGGVGFIRRKGTVSHEMGTVYVKKCALCTKGLQMLFPYPYLWPGPTVCSCLLSEAVLPCAWLYHFGDSKAPWRSVHFFPSQTLLWVGMFKTSSAHTLPDWQGIVKMAFRSFILYWQRGRKEARRKPQTCLVFSKCSLYQHKNIIDVNKKNVHYFICWVHSSFLKKMPINVICSENISYQNSQQTSIAYPPTILKGR